MSSSSSYPTIIEWFTKNDPVFVSIDGFIINIEEKPKASNICLKTDEINNNNDDDDDGNDNSSLLSLKKSQDSLNSISEATTWRRCRTCRCTFETKEEHRGHFSTPWHLYNVKNTSSKGEPPLTQDEYDAMMMSEIGGDVITSQKHCTDEEEKEEGEEEEEAESSDNGEGDDNDNEDEENDDVEDIEEEIPGRTPMVIFSDVKGEQIVVWRCVLEAISGVKKLVTIGNEEGVRSACQAFVRNIRSTKASSKWAVFMCRSGYFAGAVFDGRTLVAHKTFSRYTSRKKQGKSQSNYDAGGKHPHSAGAAKRRYQEKRYVEDVNQVVMSWCKDLSAAACHLVLVSAPKVQRSGKLLLFDGSPLVEASDVRVRKVPFPTRRPSLAEVESIHRMTFAAVPPIVVEQQQQNNNNNEEQKINIIEQKNNFDGDGEKSGRDEKVMGSDSIVSDITTTLLVNPSRLTDLSVFRSLLEKLCKSGRPKKERCAILSAALSPVCAAGNVVCAEALISNGANHSYVVEKDDGGSSNSMGMTPLHYAARSGNYDLVQLLLKAGASKNVKDCSGKVPAEYAVNDKVKEVLSVGKPKKSGKKSKNKRKKKQQQQRCVSVYDIEDSSDDDDDDSDGDNIKVSTKKKVVQKKQQQQQQVKKEKVEIPAPARVFVEPITCAICGKQEERKMSFANSGKRFCSMDCVHKFLNN